MFLPQFLSRSYSSCPAQPRGTEAVGQAYFSWTPASELSAPNCATINLPDYFRSVTRDDPTLGLFWVMLNLRSGGLAVAPFRRGA